MTSGTHRSPFTRSGAYRTTPDDGNRKPPVTSSRDRERWDSIGKERRKKIREASATAAAEIMARFEEAHQ